MHYYYSPTHNAFYPAALKQDYGDAWPTDAMPVNDDLYLQYANAAPEGMRRSAGKDGMPCYEPLPLRPAAERRRCAADAIDTAADAARARHRSIGRLIDIEYQQVIEAHGLWYINGYDDAKCPEEIRAWADAEGITCQQAASEIAEAAAHREAVISQIRSIRLAGKAAVRQAEDKADFGAVAQPFISQFESITKLGTPRL